jgi:hypothetical protein
MINQQLTIHTTHSFRSSNFLGSDGISTIMCWCLVRRRNLGLRYGTEPTSTPSGVPTTGPHHPHQKMSYSKEAIKGPHGSVVERVTSNDKVVSSILAVGKARWIHFLLVPFQELSLGSGFLFYILGL